MTKLSPLSVPYRVLQRGGSILFAVLFAVASGASAIPFVGVAGPLVFVGLAGVLVLLVVAYEVAYYERYEYELTTDTFDIRSGVFARRNREIPLRRIQNVDIRRNVVQRVIGIAAVDFETAGGSETEAAIRFVSFEEAKRLQAEIARLKRDESRPTEEDTPAAELFALSTKELALVGALSFDFRVPGALFVLASGSVPLLTSLVPDGGGLPVLFGVVLVLFLGVVLFSWAAGAVVAIVNYYGFGLRRVGDELQYERGLLQRYDGSIPVDKVQTLTIEDNPLKRYFGYATLYIETAGYAPGQGDSPGSQAAVPLATRARVERLANDIESFGSPAFDRPPRRVRRRYAARYLIALAAVTGVLFGVDAVLPGSIPWFAAVGLLPFVPVAAHYKWKHRGVWLGPNHVVTRNGVLKRQVKIVPYYRIQTIIDTRTIFQRRWDLATVTADTAGSLSLVQQDAAAVDVDAGEADRLRTALDSRLLTALAERRQTHRRRPSPGAWEPEPDRGAEPASATDEAVTDSDDGSGGSDDEEASGGSSDKEASGGGSDKEASGGGDDEEASGGGDDEEASGGGSDKEASGGGDGADAVEDAESSDADAVEDDSDD
jgi:putative membrane protein